MNRVQLCSCGSGRTQEHCCGKSSSSKNHARLFVTGVLCLALVGGAIVLGIPKTISNSGEGAGSGVATSAVANAAGGARYAADGSVIPTAGGSGRPSTIRRPDAWQFDALSNQHWNPTCWHWHDGPPPPPEQRAASSIVNEPTTTTIASDSGTSSAPIISQVPPTDPSVRFAADGSVIPAAGGSGRPSNIKNPTDGQYDPNSNQTWSASCWHWHEGKPPEIAPPAATTVPPMLAPPAANP